MSIKKLFESSNKVQEFVSDSNNKELFNDDAESLENIEQKELLSQTYRPQIDYSDPNNFVKYGSANLYYKSALTRITDFYPYDGSEMEINKFLNESLDLEKYILENGVPDVVHLQSALSGKLALWLLKEYQIPFVVTEHSSAFQRKQLSSLELAIAKEVFSSSKTNIAVSEALAHDLTALFNRKFTVIPNIVDTDYFTPSTKKSEKFTFLNVAHLNSNKNHQLLIKAFAELVKEKDARLVIAGAGEERKKLEQLIASLGLEQKVILFGRANRKEVRMLMQQANCFVLSSKIETFGIVLIEAMACGIPVVSTKCGGPNKLVEVETGILCSLTVPSMSDSMLDVMRKDMDGQLIRKKAVEKYSKNKVSEKIIDNYLLCTN